MITALLLTLASYCTPVLAPEGGVDDWLERAATRIDKSAMEWGSEKEAMPPLAKEEFSWLLESNRTNGEHCSLCISDEALSQDEANLFVCVSFSMPDSAWLGLAPELEELGGAFVLRGLPEGGFPKLVTKIQSLSGQGIRAPILIDPVLFKECDVQVVPTYVKREGEYFDKVSGNISPLQAVALFGKGDREIPETLSLVSGVFSSTLVDGRGGKR